MTGMSTPAVSNPMVWSVASMPSASSTSAGGVSPNVRDAVDVVGGQAGVLDGGADGLQRQLDAGDAGAAADPRNAEAADDRVLLEVAHRRPIRLTNVYFCNDSRLECTFLVMPDDAPPAIPARMLPKLDDTIGRSGPAAPTGS